MGLVANFPNLAPADQPRFHPWTLIVRNSANPSVGLLTDVSALPFGYSRLGLETQSSLVQHTRSAHCTTKGMST